MATVRDLEGKAVLRARALQRRHVRSAAQRSASASQLATRISQAAVGRRWRTACGYVPTEREPGDMAMIEALRGQGVRVLIPVLTSDWDLDWAEYAGLESLRTGPAGMAEGAGTPLGRGAVAEADIVLVPALLVDQRGARLGRGAGCYDRALRRVKAPTEVAAVVYDDERVDCLPLEPHDIVVAAVLTPERGLCRLPVSSGPHLPCESASR